MLFMCGRFSNTKPPQRIKERYPVGELPPDYKPRYNIAPSQIVPVIIEQERPVLKMMKWGLIPSWAKDPSIGNQMINARSESIREKPSFKRAFQQRRCLVPADGFYDITTQANPTVGQIHNRMPVILQPEDEARWLDLTTNPDQLFGLLRPYAGKLQYYPVSPRLNSPAYDDPQCIAPVREAL